MKKFLFVVLCLFLPAWGEAHTPEAVQTLPAVVIKGERPVAASSNRIIPSQEIVLQPQGRPADLLRLAPGLITLEHSGGAGKADQFLLRGFDGDHGTDLALHVDNMPVNLRSHAHGQGYADLNFIIPETIQEIVVKKGPYHVEYGDFSTAGAVDYVTRDVVPETMVQTSVGQFNTQRHLFMTSPVQDDVRTLFAGEFYYTDGPFNHANRNTRYNGLAKVSFDLTPESRLRLTLTQHYGRWNGSGQIPLREIRAGNLDRFGSIDPSEGGETARTTSRLDYHYDFSPVSKAFAKVWVQYYHFSLFTNFTFLLNDAINADGIEQNDRRWVYGSDVGYRQLIRMLNREVTTTIGLQTRIDDAHVRLGTQRKRNALAITQESDIWEASYSPYFKLDLDVFPWWRIVGGGRADVFTFDVDDRCGRACTLRPEGHATDVVGSFKGNMILGPWANTEMFLNVGTGFHSNDARDVVVNRSATTLPRAVGYEIGFKTRPWDWAEVLATLWLLDLESELVFVGDEGTTEIREESRRTGTELSMRLNPWEWLTIRGDVTYTDAEFRRTGQSVPLAPEFTAFSSITTRLPRDLSCTVQMLAVGSRAAIEDRSVLLEPLTVFDVMMRYRLPFNVASGQVDAFLSVRNVTDTDWRQAQFFYASRVSGESGGVEDLHFVPGIPRMLMGGLTWNWGN